MKKISIVGAGRLWASARGAVAKPDARFSCVLFLEGV